MTDVENDLSDVPQQVVLSRFPSTVHLVKRPMYSVPRGVVTWCNRFGFPGDTLNAWRTCRACEKAAKDDGNTCSVSRGTLQSDTRHECAGHPIPADPGTGHQEVGS